MKLLVTGSTGFIGKGLCQSLSQNNHEVIAITRRAVESSENITYVRKDIDDDVDWSEETKGVDVVVHLAGRAHIMNEQSSNPYEEYKKINVDATVNLAKQASKAGVKRFIYVSSIKVNGESTTLMPFDESDAPNPMDDYGQTKFEAEEALKKLCTKSEMELVVVRPPLVYGPGVKANFLSLINLCAKRLPLPFEGIQNKRSFIYVENLISFIILCVMHPSAANQTYLISDDDDQSLASLISIVRMHLKKPVFLFKFPKYLLVSLLKSIGKGRLIGRLLNNLQVDISKARRDLGWEPPFSFVEGIEKTLKSIKG